jgi:hypothetical protein
MIDLNYIPVQKPTGSGESKGGSSTSMNSKVSLDNSSPILIEGLVGVKHKEKVSGRPVELVRVPMTESVAISERGLIASPKSPDTLSYIKVSM